MWVELPNGKEKSKVLLRDVLYVPTMGVTLISISRIVASGSAVFFVGTSCKIYNRNKVNIGKIEVENGLYQVYVAHPETAGYSSRVKELLTIDELHCRLGHVAHDAARKLVEKGLITGVELDEASMPSFCESCKWGKGHRKPIVRERGGG